MLKLNYFLADIFILSAEKQPIKLSWRKIEWLQELQEAYMRLYNFDYKKASCNAGDFDFKALN